ncbi:gamma-glutamylcyclotransferase family protein [Neobacillus drentensis]|uniref:gamma-glutamylcyclotransferase family protein n=1 Tax=Neobacillus drentensis TaxID=220684 RepID=UPI002FFE3E83
MTDHYIFGYGSLVDEQQLEVYLDKNHIKEEVIQFCRLRTYKRTWNVAMANAENLPGYKYYIDKETGERPDVFVTYLNIKKDETSSIFGVLFKVNLDVLEQLDLRERNYERVDVTDCVEVPFKGKAWAYIGLKEAEQRFEYGLKHDKAVIALDYLNLVEKAFLTHGNDCLEDYRMTTDTPNIPKRDLKRIKIKDEHS